jgi:prepilin-type N-terminal cleavage/methylation domain-containing protein
MKMVLRRPRSQRGYSIIEVMIAMGLLASVLLSIAALFLFGRQSVYSGKQMTRAVAITTDMLEDISNMNADSAYATFGIDEDAVFGDVDLDPDQALPGDIYENSIVRSTEDISDATDPNGLLQRWQDLITPIVAADDTTRDMMANGKAFLVFTLSEDPTNDPPEFSTATVVRIRAIVRWTENTRNRQVILDTVRTNR